MDKDSNILENLAAPQPLLHVGYQKISSDPLPVSKEIDLDSSLVCRSLPKCDCLVSILGQPLVEKSVDLVPPPFYHYVMEESGDHTSHVLLTSLDSHESKSNPPIPVIEESISSIPIEHRGNHMIPPPSCFVISFDWNQLTSFHLPSYVSFEITVQAYNMLVHHTILDEGMYVSIMSSTTW